MTERPAPSSLTGQALDLYVGKWSEQAIIYVVTCIIATGFAVNADLLLHIPKETVVFLTVAVLIGLLLVVPIGYALFRRFISGDPTSEAIRIIGIRSFFESFHSLMERGVDTRGGEIHELVIRKLQEQMYREIDDIAKTSYQQWKEEFGIDQESYIIAFQAGYKAAVRITLRQIESQRTYELRRTTAERASPDAPT